MALVGETLMALNHDLAQIPISEDRVEAVLIEVRQFVAATVCGPSSILTPSQQTFGSS